MERMTEIKGIKKINELKNVYGEDIILLNDQEESEVFRILAEFEWQGVAYAVLQSNIQKKLDETAIFRIIKNEGQIELETIEDDDEWEDVSELYDELSFPIQ
jgi:uncharacterized protein YrzB (UPF0473 family)